MEQCILISGMHRSGTSAVAGALGELGVPLGANLVPAAPDNLKGFFENQHVVNLNERILNELGSTYDDTRYELSITDDLEQKFSADVESILDQHYGLNTIFAIKDPRFCLTLPVWTNVLDRYSIVTKVIHPYRHPFEVAYSLKTRNEFELEKGLILWMKYFFHGEYFSRKYERIFVSFDHLVKDKRTALNELSDFVYGINKSAQVSLNALAFVDEDLKHENVVNDNVGNNVPMFMRKVIDAVDAQNIGTKKKSWFDAINKEIAMTSRIYHSYQVQYHTQISKDLHWQRDQAQKENIELKSVIADFEHEMDSKNQIVSKLKLIAEENNESMSDQLRTIEELMTTKNDLQRQSDDASRILEENNLDLERYRQLGIDLESKLKLVRFTFSSELELREFEVNKLQKEVEEVRSSLSLSYAKEETTRLEMGLKEKEIGELKNLIIQNKEQYRDEAEELKKLVVHTEEMYQEAVDNIEIIRSDLNENIEIIDSLNQKIEVKNELINDLEKRLDNSERSLHVKEIEILEHEATIEGIKEKIDWLESSRLKLANKLKIVQFTLSSEIEFKDKTIDEMGSQIVTHEKEISDLSKRVSIEKEVNISLSEELHGVEEDSEKLNKDNQIKSDSIATLEDHISALQYELISAKSIKEDLGDRLDKMMGENETLNKKMENGAQIIQDLNSEIDNIITDFIDVKKKVSNSLPRRLSLLLKSL